MIIFIHCSLYRRGSQDSCQSSRFSHDGSKQHCLLWASLVLEHKLWLWMNDDSFPQSDSDSKICISNQNLYPENQLSLNTPVHQGVSSSSPSPYLLPSVLPYWWRSHPALHFRNLYHLAILLPLTSKSYWVYLLIINNTIFSPPWPLWHGSASYHFMYEFLEYLLHVPHPQAWPAP